VNLLLLAAPTFAQVQVDGLHVSATGSLGAGYAGEFNGSGPSDHGMGLGGAGSIGGYYYVPSFASFAVTPYYNRSQSNSESSSIQDSSGYNGVVNLFTGSKFPTGISFSQAWNSTGVFGIPGTTGLTTNGSSRTFGIGTGVELPGLPSLSVAYSQSSGSSSVYGSDGQSTGDSRSFSVKSGYQLSGFTLGGGFAHQTTNADSSILTGSTPDISTTTLNTYSVNLGHKIPFHGALGATYSRSDYNFTGSAGEGDSGTTDNASVNASVKLGLFPVSASANYTSNLYGSVVLQSINNGTPVYENTLSPESRSLLITANTSYILFHKIFLTGFVTRQDQSIAGQSYGVTQSGIMANYNFGKRFHGLTISLGMNDAADKEGNLGAGLISNVHYNRRFGPWSFDANYNYDQNVQTLLAMYTMSSMNYSANGHRHLPKGFNLSVGGGGGRSGFSETAGTSSHAESVSGSINWRGYSIGSNYSKSNGTSVLTPSGLEALSAPIVSANELVVYNGSNFGTTASANPVRNMTIAASYSNGSSTALGQALTNTNHTMLMNGLATYHFRKVNFNAGFTRLRQTVGGTNVGLATQPSALNTYYFGISRWFKLF